jgi:CHAT domain-containing protein
LGCNHSARENPEALFDQIRLTFAHGQLMAAQQQSEKARLHYSNRDSQWESRFRFLEADILIWRGLSQEALVLLQPDLPAEFAKSDLDVRQHLLRGIAYARLGKFNEADDNFDQAAQLCSASHSSLGGELARARGVGEVQKNHLDRAELFFLQSLRIARERKDDFLENTALLNLGVVSLRKEHYDEAIDWSTKAQEQAKRLDFGLDEEKALGNMAWAYYRMGDLEKSRSFYQEAEKRANDLNVEIDQVRWRDNLGLLYYQLNQPDLARRYYLRALELAQKIQEKQEIIAALNALAFVSIGTGKLQEAATYSEQSLQLCKTGGTRELELYPLLATGQIYASMQDNARAERIFAEVVDYKEGELPLRWEAMHNLAQLYEREGAVAKADREYREALSGVEKARSSLQHEEYRLPFLSNAARVYEDYIHFLVERGKKRLALQIADYSRAQTLAEGLGLLQTGFSSAINFDPQKVARETKSVILFYSLGEKHCYLWVVTANKTALMELPPLAEIEDSVQRYHRALQGPADVLETQNYDGRKLFDVLVKPAESLIPHGAEVVIVPDGVLNNLNFETLLVTAPKPHYWIEDATIVNASSLRLLAASSTSNPQRNNHKLLLIGDPLPPANTYDQLAEAGLEIKDVASHFSTSAEQIYAQAAATPGAYLQHDPGAFAYIHFVAHGSASRLSPLDSSVLLSQETPAEDSFKLYARDIVQHPLQAQLVTISACYGAGTRAYTGEGLVGLSWAFLRAGAHNVIGALWAVSDDSTPQLMDRLYDGISKGETPARALRNAKLSLLHSESVFRKPFYWAPFQLYAGL